MRHQVIIELFFYKPLFRTKNSLYVSSVSVFFCFFFVNFAGLCRDRKVSNREEGLREARRVFRCAVYNATIAAVISTQQDVTWSDQAFVVWLSLLCYTTNNHDAKPL